MQIKPLRVLGGLALLCSSLYGQSSPEEQFLHQMYGQFPYLVSMHPAVEAAIKAHGGRKIDDSKLAGKMDDSKLEISISNVKAGPIAEVLDKPLIDVYDIAIAPQQILRIDVGADEFQDFDQPKVSWPVADAKWVPADPAPPPDVADYLSKRPIKQILIDEENRLKSGLTYSRYATYNVSLKFQGKSIQYKAIAFFAVDKNGQTQALPEDGFLIATPFQTGGGIDYYPASLLHSKLAQEYQPLQQFLKSHTVDDQKCKSGRFCCVGTSCGVASADLDRELRRQQ